MKVQYNLRIDKGLLDFLKAHAAENHTTVSALIVQYIVSLKKQHEGEEK